MKTYRQLKIRKAEHEALQRVRDALWAGKFVHSDSHRSPDKTQICRLWKKPRFHMGCAFEDLRYENSSCGTIGCIGGYVGLFLFANKSDDRAAELAGEYVFASKSDADRAKRECPNDPTMHPSVYHSDPLRDLYFPDAEKIGWPYSIDRDDVNEREPCRDAYDDVDPHMAADAIDFFLITGDPQWRKVFEAHGKV